MVTITVLRHAVRIDLPHASGRNEDAKPAQVTVSIDADGNVLWDNRRMDDATLAAEIAAAAQAGGLTKIGFVTQPVAK